MYAFSFYSQLSEGISTRLDQRVNVGNHNFEVVDEFIYLGSAENKNNNVSLEIKRRIVLANRCYFGLSKRFRDKALSRATKIQLYQTLTTCFAIWRRKQMKQLLESSREKFFVKYMALQSTTARIEDG